MKQKNSDMHRVQFVTGKINMKKALLSFSLLLLILMPVTAFAHPGRTDSSGGHYNRSTGEYHYHHGYPAHDHTNGVCPYDFDDKTGSSSGSSYSSSSSSSDKYKTYWQDAEKEISELKDDLVEESIKANKLESQLSELKETLSEYKFFLIAAIITVLVSIFIAAKFKYKYDDSTGIELAKYKKEVTALQKTNREINARLLSAENKLKNKEKTIHELQNAASKPKLFSGSSVYIGTAVVDANLNALCKTYAEYVAARYRGKGYTVTTISNSNRLEKYLKATKPGKCLLIQCVYTVSSPALNEASVVALYSTYIRLNNSYLTNTTPVLITNVSLTDEAKDFAEQLNITYKENYCM